MKWITRLQIPYVEPVPWKSPNSRSGIKKSTGAPYTIHYQSKEVKKFQKIVRAYAFEAWHQNSTVLPLSGPVHLEITICRKTNDESKWGRYAHKDCGESAKGFGDLRNITKSIEDAIQGCIIGRDSQVCSTKDVSYWAENDLILVEVFSVCL